jgi:hypothetical protein
MEVESGDWQGGRQREKGRVARMMEDEQERGARARANSVAKRQVGI